MPQKLEELALDLHRIGAIKFGNFQLKNGHQTPIYCDFRDIFSYPDIWLKLIDLMIEKLATIGQTFDAICGVPYTALPLAALIGAKQHVPVLLKRKERKQYGTGKLIEGVFSCGDRVLVIEDVVTTGSSIVETATDLRAEGLVVRQVLAVLDREQSGTTNLHNNGIEFFYIFRLVQLLEILQARSVIGPAKIDSIREYLQTNKQAEVQVQQAGRLSLRYEERRDCCTSEIARKLFDIMVSKQTNLCVAVDLIDCGSILKCVEVVGAYACIVKIHCDIIEDFNFDFVTKLQRLSQQMNFLIMEDRKFADIGQIVQRQFSDGFHRIASWAHLITVHAIAGPEVLKAIEKCVASRNQDEPFGVFLVAELSTASNLIDKSYAQKAIEQGKKFERLVCGFVGQVRVAANDPGLLQLTPGVQIDSRTDGLGQVYNDPESIVCENGADIAVVGRGIVRHANVAQAAENYRKLLWAAYQKRTQ